MKIIQYKNKIDVEAGGKANFLLGLALFVGGVAGINSISKKLNLNPELLEETAGNSSVRNSIAKMNNLEWYNENPEELNWGPFAPLSVEQRKQLQQEWKDFHSTSEENEKIDQANEKEKRLQIAQNNLNKNILARTLFHEARSDGESGMRDVASVIHNRSNRSGRSMVQEALRRNQFCVWRDVPEDEKSKVIDEEERYSAPADQRAWRIAQKIADEMVSGSFSPSINADHFHTPAVSPSWSKNVKGDRRGSHLFYNLGYR